MEVPIGQSPPRLRLPLFSQRIRWIVVFLIAMVIFYFSIITTPPVVPKPEFAPLDKWQHFLAYGVFGYSMAYALTDRPDPMWRKSLVVFAIVVIYGASIELGQAPLPQRHFSVGDFIANGTGALLSLTWYLIEPRVIFVEAPMVVGIQSE